MIYAWKNIKGYENKYQVSDCGLVKRCLCYDSMGRVKKEKTLNLKLTVSGYQQVDLWKDGKRKPVSVHRLVFETFIGKIGNGRIIHHIDSNKQNNNVQNLEELTMLEHNRLHNNGRISWNKNTEYGKTEAYKKALHSRINTNLRNAKNTYDLYVELKNQSIVAKKLNISRRSVWKRIKQYKIYLETGKFLPLS
jgi:hypothetical protein